MFFVFRFFAQNLRKSRRKWIAGIPPKKVAPGTIFGTLNRGKSTKSVRATSEKSQKTSKKHVFGGFRFWSIFYIAFLLFFGSPGGPRGSLKSTKSRYVRLSGCSRERAGAPEVVWCYFFVNFQSILDRFWAHFLSVCWTSLTYFWITFALSSGRFCLSKCPRPNP